MAWSSRGASSLLALLAAIRSLGAQVVVTGVVREDSTRRPLEGVEVLVEGTKRQAATDAAGRFRLEAPTGTRIALFRAIGHRPLRVRLQLSRGDTVQADVELVKQSSAQQLDPVVSTERPTPPRGSWRVEFEDRRRLGLGKFIDSSDLRRWENRRVTDVLRGIPGVRMVSFLPDPSIPWDYEWRAASARVSGIDGSPCWMSVLFDGVPIYRSNSRGRPPDFHREFTDVSSLEGIEVFRSPAEVPLEYGGPNEECGMILLWSRRPGG